jgi:nitroimidazol reductase NimA-like FMN-containing flavoprotein (pyridoxamine 5'-phosphate oxidase superfamily)
MCVDQQMEENAKLYRPKLLIAGTSAYARAIDYGRMRKVKRISPPRSVISFTTRTPKLTAHIRRSPYCSLSFVSNKSPYCSLSFVSNKSPYCSLSFVSNKSPYCSLSFVSNKSPYCALLFVSNKSPYCSPYCLSVTNRPIVRPIVCQ